MSSPSMGRLRVAVIGAQRKDANSSRAYTAYRTVVTYHGECYERLIRYREFRAFYSRLRVQNGTLQKLMFPSKRWTRHVSLKREVVEERRVMLNDFMKKVCSLELTAKCEDHLMRLLRIGQHEDANGRVSDSLLSKSMSLRSDLPSDFRSTRTEPLPTAHEEDEDDEIEPSKSAGLSPMVVSSTTLVEVPAPVPSNASTVMTVDELSMVEDPTATDVNVKSTEAVQHAVPESCSSDESEEGVMAYPAPSTRSLTKSTSLAVPASASDMLLKQRPTLRASNSLPVRRTKKTVAFASKDADAESPTDNADEIEVPSPTHKYRERVDLHLSAIRQILSEGDELPALPVP